MHEKQTVILFDGICNLCNGAVDFLIKKDPNKQFRYVSLQSETGKRLIRKFNIPAEIDSLVLIKNNVCLFESDAVVEIAGMLPYPWKTGKMIKFIPAKIRNGLYRLIAKNRFRWFGKRENCNLSIVDDDLYSE